jgi:peptidoglycan/LPS O-acetylase OafA/YrhL
LPISLKTTKTYFENLDASRFFAFVIVFLAHAFITKSLEIKGTNSFQFIYNWGKIGLLGLEYFFVLSSFLITWIILQEKHQTGELNIKNFLIRRSLRVWPLYFLIILLGIIITFGSTYLNYSTQEIPPLSNFLLFIINFYIIDHGSEFLFFLVFLWSISIEEQFYLFYSIILKYLKINLLWISIFLILISIVFRVLYLDNSKQLYFNTLSALGNFGVGGIVAHIVFYQKKVFYQLINLSKVVNIFFYVILILSIVFYHNLNNIHAFTIFSRLYFSVLFGYFIIEQSCGKNRLFNPGQNKFINHFGKISYGLYCFHGVVITILSKAILYMNFKETFWHVFLLYPFIIFFLTIIISHYSYKYFENYFIKLKTKFYTFTSN